MKESDLLPLLMGAHALVTHSIELRVRYGETDQMGVAYYGSYLNWFECGRTELMRHFGVPYTEFEEAGLGLPVVESYCRHKRPMRYDDLFTVKTDLCHIDRAKAVFRNRIFLSAAPHTQIAAGGTLHVCVDKAGKIAAMPEKILKIRAQS